MTKIHHKNNGMRIIAKYHLLKSDKP